MQGYDGESTIGDEGAAAGPESFLDVTGTGQDIDLSVLDEDDERSSGPRGS